MDSCTFLHPALDWYIGSASEVACKARLARKGRDRADTNHVSRSMPSQMASSRRTSKRIASSRIMYVCGQSASSRSMSQRITSPRKNTYLVLENGNVGISIGAPSVVAATYTATKSASLVTYSHSPATANTSATVYGGGMIGYCKHVHVLLLPVL